jgi:hypothetical protein
MLVSVIPNDCHKAALAILLVLAIKQSLITGKSTVTTLIAPKGICEGTWAIPSQRQWHQNEERDQGMRASRKGIEDETPPLYHNSFFQISRGGGNDVKSSSSTNEERLSTVSGTKIEKGSFVDRHESVICDDVVCSKSTILTMGVIDVSGMGSNIPDLCSSIILLVDGEARNDVITVDEILLQRNVLPLFQDKANVASTEICSKAMEEDANTILESLALLCDVLVVRIGDGETLVPELMSYVMRGNRQRKLAGMEGGKVWLSATNGSGLQLRRLICDSDNDEEGDNRCHPSTTTWSALLSSAKGENNNDDRVDELLVSSLKELFASFSQQVVRSKRRSTLKSEETTTSKSSSGNAFVHSFPSVSVQYINKKSGHGTLQDGQIKQASFSTKKESINAEKGTQISSGFTKIPDENKLGQTNQQQDNDEIVGDVIGIAYRRLEDLEEKMQELVLDQSSNHMPLLEFGNIVQDILQTAEKQLIGERGMDNNFRRSLMKGIVDEVQRLHKDQLQALRNHYGQRYESILDEEPEDNIPKDETKERKWAIGAEHMTQAFLAAALNAVPAMYRSDLKDSKNSIKTRSEASFDHVDALQGLIQDMIESTERRKDEQDVATMLVADEEEEESSTDSASTSARIKRLPKLPKWLERLAARAFVFGVNYVQGWLAWQGIKRAALERDRNQPKFPLF